VAANNIKAKMESLRTTTATTATAEAITKATEMFNDAQTQNLQTKLRVSNLENSFHKQEQNTNELLNILKNNNKKIQKKHHWKLPTGAGILSTTKRLQGIFTRKIQYKD